ncbi:MAG: hypothetical protein CUN55_10235 [Phototrophicales bacterium]|nr:MAG: hypothetical protein CUN55_10235 [Phototrophicales bacterium]
MSEQDRYQRVLLLLKHGQTSQAIPLLKQHIEQNPSDTRAWWLLANIVTNVDTKRKCLMRVLQLQPDHPQAQKLLTDLDNPQQSWLQVKAKPSEALMTLRQPDSLSLSSSTSAQDFNAEQAVVTPRDTQSPISTIPKIEDLQTKRAQTQAKPIIVKGKKNQPINPLVVALGTIAVILLAVLGGLIYLRFFTGPDLAEQAENAVVAIRYPRNWMHVQHEDSYQTIVMTTSQIPTDRINPWPILTDQYQLQFQPYNARYSVTYWTHYFEWGRRLSPERVRANVEDFSATLIFQRYKSDVYVLAVLQSIPTSPQYNVNDVGRAFGQWMASGIPLKTQLREVEVKTEITPLKIEGYQGQFVEIYFTERSPLGVVRDALYIGSVQAEDYGYLLLLSCVERESGEWREAALAMTKSIRPKIS